MRERSRLMGTVIRILGRPATTYLVLPLVFLTLAAAPLSAAMSVGITSCGQEIASRKTGVLLADLSHCLFAVTLLQHARLDLNGHSISGEPNSDLIICSRSCEVNGPGTISDANEGIVAGIGEVRNYTVKGVLTVRDLTMRNLQSALSASAGIKASNLLITHGGRAFAAQRVQAADITITDSLPGETIGDGRMRFRRLVLTGSSTLGVSATALRLVDSYVMGDIGGYPGFDLVASQRPKLIRSTCGRSARWNRVGLAVGTWGVCVHDPRP